MWWRALCVGGGICFSWTAPHPPASLPATWLNTIWVCRLLLTLWWRPARVGTRLFDLKALPCENKGVELFLKDTCRKTITSTHAKSTCGHQTKKKNPAALQSHCLQINATKSWRKSLSALPRPRPLYSTAITYKSRAVLNSLLPIFNQFVGASTWLGVVSVVLMTSQGGEGKDFQNGVLCSSHFMKSGVSRRSKWWTLLLSWGVHWLEKDTDYGHKLAFGKVKFA